MREFELFIENLKALGQIELELKKPLSSVSTIGVGGIADFFIMPNGARAMCEVVKKAKERKIPVFAVGNSSNVIYPDEGVRGAVICTKNMSGFRVKSIPNGARIFVGAGLMLPQLCKIAFESSLSGFEGLCSVPGTVGGAIISNAGAYGYSVSDYLIGIFLLNGEGRLTFRRVKKNDFAYRECRAVKHGEMVLGAVFLLKKADKKGIFEKMQSFREMRRQSQPVGVKSVGSFFKRPTELISAGELIDRCGLKGFSVGGAMVSQKHANFIVNASGASAKDVIELARKVRKNVFSKTGIMLEPEPVFVGKIGENGEKS